jgi:glycosyltransferase involved in cell wall biosynthesis
MRRLSVSVIMPTFNRAAFIGEALASLLSQTQVPDQIVVVDDGSTDQTAQILSGYGPPITVRSQSNAGPARARNTGLRAATGDLIAFLDSDDTLTPDSIERRVRALEQNADYDAVYSDVLMVNEDCQPLARYSKIEPGPRPSGLILLELARHNLMPIHAFMFRRRCLDEIGLFDEALQSLEDYDFWLRMAGAFRFLYLDEPLACYRVHSGMITTMQRERRLADGLALHRRIFDMPAFDRLSLHEKARVYVEHGNRCAMHGRMAEARGWYGCAVRATPISPRGYLFAALTLLGKDGFRRVIKLRQRLRGNPVVFED